MAAGFNSGHLHSLKETSFLNSDFAFKTACYLLQEKEMPSLAFRNSYLSIIIVGFRQSYASSPSLRAELSGTIVPVVHGTHTFKPQEEEEEFSLWRSAECLLLI